MNREKINASHVEHYISAVYAGRRDQTLLRVY